jgi:hypothetical protein
MEKRDCDLILRTIVFGTDVFWIYAGTLTESFVGDVLSCSGKIVIYYLKLVRDSFLLDHFQFTVY